MTKEIAAALLTLLQRVQVSGAEVDSYLVCRMALQAILQAKDEGKPNG